MNKQDKKKLIHTELKNLTLFHDVMIDPVFKNKECVYEVLRVIRKNNYLSIKKLLTKQEVHNLNGKDIEMDIYTEVDNDSTEHINLEIQRNKDKAPLKRLVYYQGMLLGCISDKVYLSIEN